MDDNEQRRWQRTRNNLERLTMPELMYFTILISLHVWWQRSRPWALGAVALMALMCAQSAWWSLPALALLAGSYSPGWVYCILRALWWMRAAVRVH